MGSHEKSLKSLCRGRNDKPPLSISCLEYPMYYAATWQHFPLSLSSFCFCSPPPQFSLITSASFSNLDLCIELGKYNQSQLRCWNKALPYVLAGSSIIMFNIHVPLISQLEAPCAWRFWTEFFLSVFWSDFHLSHNLWWLEITGTWM